MSEDTFDVLVIFGFAVLVVFLIVFNK